jgi:CrcB protein
VNGVQTALGIAALGAVGSVSRWLLGNLVQKWAGARFPVGTLAVNLIGSAAIGFVMTLFFLRGEIETRARLVLTAGLLGGFTTYSSFAYESVELLERAEPGRFAMYLGGTVVGCLFACWGGIAAARLLAT